MNERERFREMAHQNEQNPPEVLMKLTNSLQSWTDYDRPQGAGQLFLILVVIQF